jgi:uncharacterized protein (DUF1697 family)
MASVVFLRGVNVGGHRLFRPSVFARELVKYGVVNVGAAGTFVVRKPISQAKLRAELLRRLPFEAEAMICAARELISLPAAKPFAGEASSSELVRFVSVFAKRPRGLLALPLTLPPGAANWLLKIFAVRGRFAFGIYRRTVRTIGVFGQLEKHLGGSVTTRNWNTITTIIEILGGDRAMASRGRSAILKR